MQELTKSLPLAYVNWPYNKLVELKIGRDFCRSLSRKSGKSGVPRFCLPGRELDFPLMFEASDKIPAGEVIEGAIGSAPLP